MGSWTLEEFRSELSETLGLAPGFRNERLDRWINKAYVELASALEFDELKAGTSISTTNGLSLYQLPSDLLGVSAVTDDTNKTRLLRLSFENYWSRDRAQRGKPTRWARAGANLYLWPTPDATYTVWVIYWKEPTKLSSATERTVLPSAWDYAIFLLACHAAVQSLPGRAVEEVDAWLVRAREYIGSRIKSWDHDARPSALYVATDASDLEVLE